MSQLSDFIDRAKLEAEAEKRYPIPEGHNPIPGQARRDAFMAGAAAYAALLEAETTEERASRIETLPGGGAGTVWYARKVLHGPWVRTEFGNSPRLPSEGGEKRG